MFGFPGNERQTSRNIHGFRMTCKCLDLENNRSMDPVVARVIGGLMPHGRYARAQVARRAHSDHPEQGHETRARGDRACAPHGVATEIEEYRFARFSDDKKVSGGSRLNDVSIALDPRGRE